MSGHILFYVQHLLGVGHVFRAMRIVRALTLRGFTVDLVYGGEPVPNLDAGSSRLHYLPPLRAGRKQFGLLERPDGSVADDAYKADRREKLLAIVRRAKPDAIITEAFPFGRRQMQFELIPMLEAVTRTHPKPILIASIRDILQERSKPGRHEETVALVQRYFDHVLIHADPDIVRLEETFPLADQIADKLHYTGIVAPEIDANATQFRDQDVIVSVGGGMLGRELLLAAAEAKPKSCLRDANWVFSPGPRLVVELEPRLHEIGGRNVSVVPFIADLPSAMANVRLSISRCGYNTVADLFSAGCRGILCPLSDGVETEQLKRAALLSKKNVAEILFPDQQDSRSIAEAVDRAMSRDVPDRSQFNLNGIGTTVALVEQWLQDGAAR